MTGAAMWMFGCLFALTAVLIWRGPARHLSYEQPPNTVLLHDAQYKKMQDIEVQGRVLATKILVNLDAHPGVYRPSTALMAAAVFAITASEVEALNAEKAAKK
jgi:hypothetical protein